MSSFGSKSSRGTVVSPPPTALTPEAGGGRTTGEGRDLPMTGNRSFLTTTKTSLSSSPNSGRGGIMPPLQEQQQQLSRDGGRNGKQRGGGMVMEQHTKQTLGYRGHRSNGNHHNKNRQHDSSKKKQLTSKSSSLSRSRRKPGSRQQQPQQQERQEQPLEKPSLVARQRSAPSTSMEAIVASLNQPSREVMYETHHVPPTSRLSQNGAAGSKGEAFSHHVRHWSLGDGAPLGRHDATPVTANESTLATNPQRPRTSSADRIILGRNRTLLDDEDDFFLSEPSVSSNGGSDDDDELAGDGLEASSDDEDKQQQQQQGTLSPPPPPASPSPSVVSGNLSPSNTSLSSRDLSSPGRISNGKLIRIHFGSDASSDGGGGTAIGHDSPHQLRANSAGGRAASSKGGAPRVHAGLAPQIPLGRQLSSLTTTTTTTEVNEDNRDHSRNIQSMSPAFSNTEKTPKMANDETTMRKTTLDGPTATADLDKLDNSNDNTRETGENKQGDAHQQPINRRKDAEGENVGIPGTKESDTDNQPEPHGREKNKEAVDTQEKSGSGGKDDEQLSADDEKTYQRPRRKRISASSPAAHRRTRSGDNAAASLLTGGNDWVGMETDKLPIPADDADVVDEEQDDEVPQLEETKFSVGAAPALRSPRLASGRRRLRRRSDAHLQTSSPHNHDGEPAVFLPVTPTVRYGAVPPVVNTLERLDSISTLGGGEGELSGSRRSVVSEDFGGTWLSKRYPLDREEKIRASSAMSGGSSNDSQGSKSVFSWISSRMSMVSRPKALGASMRRSSAPVSAKDLRRGNSLDEHASREEDESSLHLSDDDTEVDKEQAERAGSGPDLEAPSPSEGKRQRTEQEKEQEEEKLRRLEAFEMHVRSLSDLGRDPSFHRPAIAVSDEEAMKYPTFMCPNCNTRQREFFSVNSAPREFESPASYLAIYFGVYVVAALCIFGLQEGWAPLDCVYFSVITLTTAGLGDLVPRTDSAKIICSIFIYFGVACIGLLLGSLLASSLDDESRKAAKENQVKNCPNCAQLKSHASNRGFHATYLEHQEKFAPPPPPPPQQPSPRYPNPLPSESRAQSSKGEEESSFDGTCDLPSSSLPRPSLAKRHKSDQGNGRDREWSQIAEQSTSQTSNGGSRPRGDSGVSRRSFQRVGLDGLAPVDEEAEAAPVSANQESAPKGGWSAGTEILQQQQERDQQSISQSQAAATQSDTATSAPGHKRYFSLDYRTLGVNEATETESNRVRNFSIEVGAMSTGNSKAPPSGIGVTNNDGWGSVAASAAPHPQNLFDEMSDYSSSSMESENRRNLSGRFKAAKYVFLTLRQALANSIFIIAIGGFGFYFIERMRAVDAFYFTTVLLTTVGYGDIVPHTAEGKMFATLYVLVAGTVLLHNMSLISMIPLELRKRRIEEAVLMQFGDHLDDLALHELATGPLVQRLQLRATRADGLEECTREMFALAMLVRLGRVSEQDVLSTFEAFRRLDVDDDGKLTSKEIVMGEVERRRTRLRKLRMESRRQCHASVSTDTSSLFASFFGWGKRPQNMSGSGDQDVPASRRFPDDQGEAMPFDHSRTEDPHTNDHDRQMEDEDVHHVESEHAALLPPYHMERVAVDPRVMLTLGPEAQQTPMPTQTYASTPYYPYGQYMSFVPNNEMLAAGMDPFTSLDSFLESSNSQGVDRNDAPPAIRTRGMSSESSFSGMTASTAGEDANESKGEFNPEELHGTNPGQMRGVYTGIPPPPPPPPPAPVPPMSPTRQTHVVQHPHLMLPYAQLSPHYYSQYQAPTYLQLSPQLHRPARLQRPQHGRVQSFAGSFGGGQAPVFDGSGGADDQYRSRFWSSEAARKGPMPAYE